MESLAQDLRYAARMLRRSPTFTLVAALVIALGTTAVTTIFSVANTLLLRPAPGIGDPARVVAVSAGDGRHGPVFVSYPLYRDLRSQARTLDGLAGHAAMRADVGIGRDDQRRSHAGYVVTANYFDVLRVRPALGRFFLPEEDRAPMAAPVAVVSWRFFQERLGGDRAALGRTLWVNGAPFTLVGVAPEGFGGTIAFVKADLFVPAMMHDAMAGLRGSQGDPRRRFVDDRGARWLSLVGRLRDGVDHAAAQGELAAVARRAEAAAGLDDTDLDLRVTTLRAVPAQGETPTAIFLTVLLTLAGLVLAIASTNVASMLLARGLARRRELVARLALGAARGRLVRQLLTESVLLFALGGTAGVLATAALTRAAERLDLRLETPLAIRIPVDGRVLAFTLALSLAAGIVFGLVPALDASRRDLASALRGGASATGERRQRARGAFVVAQLAMSVLLLVAAGLFARAYQRGRLVDPGFHTRDLVVASVDLSTSGYDSVRVAAYRRDLLARVAALPGVRAASYTEIVPLTGSVRMNAVDVPGHEPPRGMPHDVVTAQSVGRDWFRTIGLPLVRGRAFDARDLPGSAPVAIVTEAFARRFWPNDDPLGKSIRLDGRGHTVVGVARDARLVSAADDPSPHLFLDAEQDAPPNLSLVARTDGEPAALAAAIRREIRAMDPTLAPPRVLPFTEAAAAGVLPQRVSAGVTGALGLAGVLLAAVGLYGVVAYGVSQRTGEIGVRLALGAAPGDVVRMVLRGAARLTAIGLAIGLAAGIGVGALGSRSLPRVLFGIDPVDPLTLVAVPVVLGLVTLAASWVPARRAASLPPSGALRGE